MEEEKKSLWELLWDYDPNGLLAVDSGMIIRVVNPALCKMLHSTQEDMLGKDVREFLDDISDFEHVMNTNNVILAKEEEYPKYGIVVKKVMFSIKDRDVIGCIMVDITHASEQNAEMRKLKAETLEKVKMVVDNQMRVAQEIAGLLGETTAETKISLIKLMNMFKQERT
jgi:PAS domain S-box-containing protein